MRSLDPETLFTILSGLANFGRGVPRDPEIQNAEYNATFRQVLSNGGALETQIDDDTTLQELHECQRGYLHADREPGGDVVYYFASPLHAAFVDWKIRSFATRIPIDEGSPLEFSVAVIKRFSSKNLRAERRIGAGYVERPPEARYQDEFYRCCYEHAPPGSFETVPEFKTANGRMDVVFPENKWGIEIMREGEGLVLHSGRFAAAREFGKWVKDVAVDDFVMLDFRRSTPPVQYCGSVHSIY